MICVNRQRLVRAIGVCALLTASATACHRAGRSSLGPEWEPGPWRDSLIRAVPLDSLHALYRAMLTSGHPKPIEREIVCEGLRLTYLYGDYIASTAIDRLRDTVWHKSERHVVERMDEKLAGSMGAIRMSDCNIPYDRPKAPDSLDVFPPFKRKNP